MQACIQFLLDDGVKVKVEFTLNLDNSAAKAFFFRSGVGRIRHISGEFFGYNVKSNLVWLALQQ